MSPRLLVFAALLCACSGNVQVDSTTGTGGSGGETTAGGGGSPVTGTGGVLVGGGGSGGSTQTTSTTGTAGGPGCPGIIDVDIDGAGEGPTMPLTWNCANDPPGIGAWGALGYLGKGGPMVLMLIGCTGPGDVAAPGELFMWGELTDVGSTTSGHAELTVSGKQHPSTDEIWLEVSQFGPVGGMITGQLAFDIPLPDGTSNPYSAKFQVCRHPDLPPPP